MKLSSINSIFDGANSPQFSQSPLPLAPQVSQETYGEGFFDEPEEEMFDEQSEDPNFQDNLAEDMSETYLDKLASQFRQNIDDDETDRKPWMDMISTVQEQIGLGQDSNYEETFPGCSTVVYPLITKAQIQFQARALPEIFPNDPVKSLIIGDSTPELEAQGERVADVMNYQVQYQDKGNKKDFRKMLWWLPLTGSAFRYVSHDPLRNINIVRFVPAGDLIVPYATTSLQEAPRFAYRFKDTRNEVLKLQQCGFYREVDLFDAHSSSSGTDSETDNAATTLRDASDGMVPDSDNSTTGVDQTCYNIYTYCDLEGYEDEDDKGELTGIELPYVFTMHEDTGKILAIRRNWKEDDEYKQQRIFFSHYKYQEGAGFYGSGLPHLIGSLQTATTGALRAFGDSMAFSLLQGGFKLKGARVAGDLTIKPGEFPDIDGDFEDIRKVFYPLNFPAPSPQAIQYIEMLSKQAEEIVSTTDIMTGDSSPQNSPVGSTLAMIEQSSKVISAQHKSLYESFSEELQILAELNYDFLPEEDQFVVPGKSGVIRREDFNGKIDVIPTADPSVSSMQQRLATDQAVMQLGSIPEFKPFFKESGYPLFKRMLNNLKVPDIDSIIIDEQTAMQLIQQMQQNPPPNPDMIKAQVMQADSQTKAQTAQSDSQLKMQDMQLRAQLEQATNQIAMLKLQLENKKIDMDFATNDKMIDARFLGSVVPGLQQSSDALAMQNISHEQTKELQQGDQQHQMTMQRMGAAQAMQQQAAQPMPAAEGQTPEAPDAQAMHDQMMESQASAQQQSTPDKQGMLMRLMNKIRGR